SYRLAGENIAMGHTSPIFSHHSLMNSKEHRVNTLNDSYTHLGIGVDYNADEVPYYTENYIKKQIRPVNPDESIFVSDDYFVLKFPEQTDDFSKDSHAVKVDRFECRVFRLQTIISFFFIEAFNSCFILIGHSDNDITIMGDILFADNDAVSIKNTRINHTVSGYVEQEYFTIVIRSEMFR